MNPWKPALLELLRNVLRFALWVAIVVNGLMFAVFSVAFISKFLWYSWNYLCRTMFGHPW